MTTTTEKPRVDYIAVPFVNDLSRAEVVSKIVRGLAKTENIFTDYQQPCESRCLEYTCDDCKNTMAIVVRMLTKPGSKVWEVWSIAREDGTPLDLVGILYLTDVTAGCDALAHYVFFDSDLAGKTSLLKATIDAVFTDGPDWRALRRLTIEVPEHAFSLVRHATKKLGFGGPFTYSMGSMKVPVEGVKRNAKRWRGRDEDVLILGLLNERDD